MSDDIAAAMARIRKTLEERMAAPPPRLPVFEWKKFGRAVRAARDARGITQQALADEIGITPTDLSRAAGNGNIAVEKVIAICDGLGLKLRSFYRKPPASRAKSKACTSHHVKQGRDGSCAD